MPEPLLLGAPGSQIAFRAYPAAQPWLHLLVSHGFSEHMGWWHHVAAACQARGVSTYLFDHYHHGRSAGRRGDAPAYGVFCDGIRLALTEGVAAGRPKGAPLVLLGHSNGALAALLCLGALPPGTVNGLVLSSPLLALRPRTRLYGGLLASVLRWVVPSFRVPLALRPWRLTHDRKLWRRYATDPLRFRCISVRFFVAMLEATRRAQAIDHVDVPLRVQRGEEERMVDARAIDAWAESVAAPDKHYTVYPGMRHELFNELGWERVVDDLVGWCRERFGDRPSLPGGAG